MREHRIRLRGAWERVELSDVEVIPRRVDLPTHWTVRDLSGSFRLTRKFGCPPMEREFQTVDLELGDVPGLMAARLNGQILEYSGLIAVDEILLPKNLLELEVDFKGISQIDPSSVWGSVALVIADRSR